MTHPKRLRDLRSHTVTAIAAALLTAVLVVDATGQTIESPSSSTFGTRIGETVLLTTMSGRVIRGVVSQLRPLGLDLLVNDTSTPFGSADIRRLEVFYRDPVRDGTLRGLLIGALGGFGLGTVAALSCNPDAFLGCFPGRGWLVGGFTLEGAGFGSLIGVIADAAHRSRRVVYSAPGTSVAIVPAASRGGFGATLTVHWR